MADNDVRIKLSIDGDKVVISGLNGVGDSASEADSKLGSFVSGGLKGAGVALAGLAAAGVAAGAALSGAVISSYADYEQNLGGIETMFKDSSDTMVAYADQAYMTAGLSANEYMNQVTSFSASLLQGLGGDTAAAAEVANTAMVDMSDNANKFGSNITDIQNAYQGFAKQNYTMLDNLKLGYGGTQSEMARLINDSGVLGDTMDVTAQTVNDVSFDKIIEAIHTVQTEMGIAGTTALEAEQTISGSIGMLRGSFDNLLTGLGSADADVATLAGNVITSLQTVVTNVGPVIENIGSNMQTLGPQLGTMIEGLVGTVSSAVPGLLNAGVAMIGGLIQGIGSALPGLVTAIVPAISGLVEMVATQLPLLIDAGMKAVIALGQGLVAALPTLIPAVVGMIPAIAETLIANLPMLLDVALQLIMGLATGLLEAIPALVAALPQLIISIVDFLVSAIPQIIEAGITLLMGIVGALPQIITGIVDAIPLIITGVLEAIINSIPQLIQAGIDLLMGLIGALPQIITGIVKAIPQIIQGVLGAVIGAIPQLIQAGVELLVSLVRNLPTIIVEIVKAIPEIITGIVNAIVDLIPMLVDAGGDLLRGLWEGISGAAGWLWDKVSGWAGGLMDGVKDFFGIKSPSRRMRDEVGEQLPAGVGVGVEQNEDAALGPVRDLNKKITLEAKKLQGLRFDYGVTVNGGSPAQAQTAAPMYATPGTVASNGPTIVLDTAALAAEFERWAANGGGATEVNQYNDIKMFDRDERVVMRQQGRALKGELVG